MSPWALNRLVHAISAGAVIGYPTDTIWGLGCDPLDFASVARILQIKNRRPDKGLILLSSRLEYCSPYIDIDAGQRESLLAPCARPTTWLVNASEASPGGFAESILRSPFVSAITPYYRFYAIA